jgi:hypothetical protein
MRPLRSTILLGLTAVAMLAPFAVAAGTAQADTPNFDDAAFCSKYLSTHDDKSLPPAAHRRCVLAIATTYILGEENTIPPEQELLADDIARHLIGTPRVSAPGGRAKIIAAQPASKVIAGIKNRQWTVDGNDAWILYDGYLTSDPNKPQFFVAERITVEKGLIEEIMIAGVSHAK